MAHSNAVMQEWLAHYVWCTHCAQCSIHDEACAPRMCALGVQLQARFLPLWRDEGERLDRVGLRDGERPRPATYGREAE